jgi:hypothetical protein
VRVRPEPILLVLQAIQSFLQLSIILGLNLGLQLGCFLVRGDGRSATHPGNSDCDSFDLLFSGVSGYQECEAAKRSEDGILWNFTVLD